MAMSTFAPSSAALDLGLTGVEPVRLPNTFNPGDPKKKKQRAPGQADPFEKPGPLSQNGAVGDLVGTLFGRLV